MKEKQQTNDEYWLVYKTATYPTKREAELAFQLFKAWIRHNQNRIYFRNYLALARKPCPLLFFHYGWTKEMLHNIHVSNKPYRIEIPEKAIIFYEE